MGKGKLSYETGARFLLGKNQLHEKHLKKHEGEKMVASDCLLQVLLVQHIYFIQAKLVRQLIQ